MNWNILQLDLYLCSLSVQLYTIQCTTLSAWRHKIHPLHCKTNISCPFSTINSIILDGGTLLGMEHFQKISWKQQYYIEPLRSSDILREVGLISATYSGLCVNRIEMRAHTLCTLCLQPMYPRRKTEKDSAKAKDQGQLQVKTKNFMCLCFFVSYVNSIAVYVYKLSKYIF